jgi:hypothetical protein
MEAFTELSIPPPPPLAIRSRLGGAFVVPCTDLANWMITAIFLQRALDTESTLAAGVSSTTAAFLRPRPRPGLSLVGLSAELAALDVLPPGGSGEGADLPPGDSGERADCSAFVVFFGIILDFFGIVLVVFGLGRMDVEVDITFEISLGFCLFTFVCFIFLTLEVSITFEISLGFC